jgi:hypothetical protein
LDLRIRHLENLDPQAVALPHGTEVVTRVDRLIGERRVPQGTIGRVVKIDGDDLDVLIVGVGTLRYARRELSPRRIGQIRYAQRRERAWEALLPCVVLDATVGSKAWGLASDTSDDDRRGVFAHPLSWTLGLVAPPEDLVREDGSATYWAYGKAVRQALRADPNTLEALFGSCVEVRDPIGAWILAERDAFVSTEIYGSFGRYALGQLRRLEQGQRLAEHRATVLEWLRAEPDLSLDAVAAKLARISPRAAPLAGEATSSEADAIHQAKQYVKQLYRSLFDQGLIEAAELRALAVFAREAAPTLELPRELRPKNAYNLLRLIATAARWLREGTPTFEVDGSLKARLLAVKRGEDPLEEVLAEAEAMSPDLEAARDASKLPARPDVARADALLRKIGDELARRWTQKAPGPFGADAPAPPEVVWSE